jgi:hypothetical protein
VRLYVLEAIYDIVPIGSSELDIDFKAFIANREALLLLLLWVGVSLDK